MAEIAELVGAYGYRQDGDWFVPGRPSSERWQRVEGGYACYTPITAAFGGGMPWGRVVPGEGIMQVPWTQKPEYANASGLHPSVNPDTFEWVWSQERLEEIYEHAVPAGENPWVKETDESGAVSYRRTS
jgi:hypothetical protein